MMDNPEPDTHEQPPKWLRDAGMIGLGSTLTVGMAGFTLAGYYLGRRYDHLVPGILIGVAFGLFFCGYEVWKLVRRKDRSSFDDSGKGA